MRPHGLRARVVLAAAVAIVAAVVLLALAVPALLSRQLERSLDTSLRARAADVARLAASSPDLVTERGALEGGGLLVQVVDRYVAYLRRKLGDPQLIHTVRGVGFRLDAP